MKKEIRRAYHRSDRAYYAKVCGYTLPNVMFGDYPEDGGTRGEMVMEWHDLNDGKLTPQLQCFSYAFTTLISFKDVVSALAKFKDRAFSDDQFCEVLDSLGFKDITAYENKR